MSTSIPNNALSSSTIHNVAFDTSGHCFATETENEENNIFTGNLGAATKRLTSSNGQSDSPEKITGRALRHFGSEIWKTHCKCGSFFYGTLRVSEEILIRSAYNEVIGSNIRHTFSILLTNDSFTLIVFFFSIGNVAAGSESIGFWLEMLDKYSNQLNPDSFRDNVAHSNYQCLLTYKRGW